MKVPETVGVIVKVGEGVLVGVVVPVFEGVFVPVGVPLPVPD